MNYRPLGSTGLQISELSFGAGPVAGLMTDREKEALQRKTIRRALEAGINWFDTAPTYGAGQSETNLGRALADLCAPPAFHLATKVRLLPEQLAGIKDAVQLSVAESLRRLRRPRVTLIQLHNSITQQRDEQPTSITPRDLLGPGGVLEAFEELRRDGKVEHFGLTGLGDTAALEEVIRSGPWATVQVCKNVLRPQPPGIAHSRERAALGADPIVSLCGSRGVGVIAIRVLAGGALAGQPPSAHTLTTKFFPLAQYRQDEESAARLAKLIRPSMNLKELAIRYVLSDPQIATALIGFAEPAQIDEAARFAAAGALDPEILNALPTVEPNE